MPNHLPCPICKSPIDLNEDDANGKVSCALCLHEFRLQGQRLTPWVEREDCTHLGPVAPEPVEEGNITTTELASPLLDRVNRDDHDDHDDHDDDDHRPRDRRVASVRRAPRWQKPFFIVGMVVL